MTRDEVLGVWGRAPRRLTASPRRRRLVLVCACAPGLLAAVLGPQLWQDPRWLGFGALLLAAAALARRVSEPRFRAWEALAGLDSVSAQEPDQ